MKWKALLFSLGFLLCGGQAWSLSLSEVITQARLYLKDTASSTTRRKFSDSQLTSFINNGQKEINSRTWCVIGSTRITLLSGTTEYSLPSDFILPLRVTVDHVPIVERPFVFLDEKAGNWITEPSGTPREYYIRVDSSVVTGVSKESIGVHPVSSYTITLVAQYLQQPADLSADADIPFSGNLRLYPLHQALAYYAAYRGYLVIGMLEEAAIYYRDYDLTVQYLEANDGTRMTFNPSFRGARPVSQGKQ